MDMLQNFEDLLNDLVSLMQYSKVFAIAVCVAFLIVFSGMVIINSNLHEVQAELKEIKAMIKGEKENG